MKVTIELEIEKVKHNIISIKTRCKGKLIHLVLLDFNQGYPTYQYEGVRYAVDQTIYEALKL
jgi:hypothetical protein